MCIQTFYTTHSVAHVNRMSTIINFHTTTHHDKSTVQRRVLI